MQNGNNGVAHKTPKPNLKPQSRSGQTCSACRET